MQTEGKLVTMAKAYEGVSKEGRVRGVLASQKGAFSVARHHALQGGKVSGGKYGRGGQELGTMLGDLERKGADRATKERERLFKKSMTARTPSGKYVSHVNDLAVYHVRPRHTGPSGKLLRVSKMHDWVGKENDGVKLMDPRVEIPTANRVGRRIPKSVENVEKAMPPVGSQLTHNWGAGYRARQVRQTRQTIQAGKTAPEGSQAKYKGSKAREMFQSGRSQPDQYGTFRTMGAEYNQGARLANIRSGKHSGIQR